MPYWYGADRLGSMPRIADITGAVLCGGRQPRCVTKESPDIARKAQGAIREK
jgi:hypothetical protein